jgi:SH3-like domain-containing protein
MYYRRTKPIAIGSALILGVATLALIPAQPSARVSEISVPAITSTETVATIDAMLGTSEPFAAPAAERETVRGPAPVQTASIQPAALNTEIPEAAPAIDPSLRADAIGSKAVNLRSGPSTDTATVTVLQPGQSLHVGADQGGWTQITLDDGTTGFVSSRYLASVAATMPAQDPAPAIDRETTRKAVVSGGDGNLEGRTARIESRIAVLAAPNGETLFRTEPGERVRILDTRGDWLRIRTADGTTGWIQRAG